MCGRYALYGPASRYRERFGLDQEPEWLPRWNVAPQTKVPIVRIAEAGTPRWSLVRWGLIPAWAKDEAIAQKLINARGETVAEKPSFRAAFKRRRCLIPADAFYEWQANPGGKQPWAIGLASHEPMAFAGLWETWSDAAGQPIETCCIVTTSANALMAPLHARMPVILPEGSWGRWLDPVPPDPAALTALIVPLASEELVAWPVSKAVNRVGNDGPALIEAVAL